MDALTAHRLPTYFISHGGGPWPWMTERLGDYTDMIECLQSIPVELGGNPRAILMISAHWEMPEFTVQVNPNPPMLYDYGGFPPHTYEVQYPAPGSPELAHRVGELLGAAGWQVYGDPQRGFDHGMFAPMAVAWPAAEVPVVQLSLKHTFDPAEHIAAGRALAPLRDDGVLIVGSGFSFHNLRGLMGAGGAVEASVAFDDWLGAAMQAPPAERTHQLIEWETAPAARLAHPREEHLLPLMVALGAAEHEPAVRNFNSGLGRGVMSSGFRFGALPSEHTTPGHSATASRSLGR